MTTIPQLAGISYPGAGLPSLANFVVPAFPNGAGTLVGLYSLANDVDLSTFNFASPGNPLLKSGAPAMGTLGATLSSSAYYDTQLPSTAGMTVIAVAKSPINLSTGANQNNIINNFQNTSPVTGDTFGFANSGSLGTFRAIGQYTGGVQSSTIVLTGADSTKWNTFAGRIRPTGEVKAWWSASGAVTTGVETVPQTRGTPQSRTLLLGKDYSTQYPGAMAVLMVAVFNSALADSDVVANLAYLTSTYGPALGITTL